MSGMFGQTVTRVRAGSKTNRAGDAVPDWDHATRATISPVSVQPLSTTERVAIGGDLSIAMSRIYTAPGGGADVLATDRIEFEGNVFEVFGTPERWPDPARGGVHHVEITIKLWGAS